MKMYLHTLKSPPCCCLNTFLILLVGWTGSAIIYLTAGDTVENPFADFETSKNYMYEVERMGGRSAVIANDVAKWFDGLWHGESLALTVAVITLLIASAYYFIASDTSRAELG